MGKKKKAKVQAAPSKKPTTFKKKSLAGLVLIGILVGGGYYWGKDKGKVEKQEAPVATQPAEVAD